MDVVAVDVDSPSNATKFGDSFAHSSNGSPIVIEPKHLAIETNYEPFHWHTHARTHAQRMWNRYDGRRPTTGGTTDVWKKLSQALNTTIELIFVRKLIKFRKFENEKKKKDFFCFCFHEFIVVRCHSCQHIAENIIFSVFSLSFVFSNFIQSLCILLTREHKLCNSTTLSKVNYAAHAIGLELQFKNHRRSVLSVFFACMHVKLNSMSP